MEPPAFYPPSVETHAFDTGKADLTGKKLLLLLIAVAEHLKVSMAEQQSKPFEFSALDHPFHGFTKRELADRLLQWGLKESCLKKFHFNQRFRKATMDTFLTDFLSSPCVLDALPSKPAGEGVTATGFKWAPMNTSVISLEFFDRMFEANIGPSCALPLRFPPSQFHSHMCPLLLPFFASISGLKRLLEANDGRGF
jgi:hypothetical protein